MPDATALFAKRETAGPEYEDSVGKKIDRARMTKATRQILSGVAHADDDSALSAKEFFDAVDVDGNGMISLDEFKKLYGNMRVQMRAEHEKEAVAKKETAHAVEEKKRSERRNRVRRPRRCLLRPFLFSVASIAPSAAPSSDPSPVSSAPPNGPHLGCMAVHDGCDEGAARRHRSRPLRLPHLAR